MDNEISSHDTASFLQWAGCALIVIYGVTVMMDIMPIALLQPAWLVRFSGKVLGGGALALTGVVLLVLALHFDPKVLPLSRFQQGIRGLAHLVALLLLLLIPVQTIAGLAVLNDDSRDIQRQLNQLQQATELISIANSETALIKGLALLPGAPKSQMQKITVPFAIVKTQVLRQLNRQIPVMQTRIDLINKLRLEKGMTLWFKQAVISFAYAMAFWALGSTRNQLAASQRSPSPLALVLSPILVLQNLGLGRRDPIEIPPEWLESSNPAEHTGKS